MIDLNHPVRIVNQVIYQIDIDPLLAKFKGGGTSIYHTLMLLKVLLFAYLSNIYSSCRMEATNRFRSERLKGFLKQVFGKVVELLVAEGLVTLQEVYVDGTKIEVHAHEGRPYSFLYSGMEGEYRSYREETPCLTARQWSPSL